MRHLGAGLDDVGGGGGGSDDDGGGGGGGADDVVGGGGGGADEDEGGGGPCVRVALVRPGVGRSAGESDGVGESAGCVASAMITATGVAEPGTGRTWCGAVRPALVEAIALATATAEPAGGVLYAGSASAGPLSEPVPVAITDTPIARITPKTNATRPTRLQRCPAWL